MTRRAIPDPRGPSRTLARDLVALLEHDMQYIAWFVAVARAYPDDAATMDWPAVMQVARAARLPLQVATALLTARHRTPSDLRTPEQVAALRSAKRLSHRHR